MSTDAYLNPYNAEQIKEANSIFRVAAGKLTRFEHARYELYTMFHRPLAKARIEPIFSAKAMSSPFNEQDEDKNLPCRLVASLPEEIKVQIFSELDPRDAVCLALTCKRQASTFQRLHQINEIKKSQARKAGKTGRKPSASRKQRLDVLVRLDSWFSREWRLCYGCCRYKKKATKPNEPWTGDTSLVRERKTTEAAQKTGPHCPLCTKRMKLEAIKFRHEVKTASDKVATLCG